MAVPRLVALYYGSASPSAVRRAAVHAATLVLILVGYGFWTEFAPSPYWYRAGSIATAIFTAVVCALALFANARGHHFYLEGVSEIKKGFGVIVVPTLIFGLSWFGMVFGVGALFTQIAGSSTMVETRASKAYSPSRRFCDYRLVPEGMPSDLKICMSAEQFAKFDSGSIVRLLGKKSPLGLHVDKWQSASRSVENGPPKSAAHLQR